MAFARAQDARSDTTPGDVLVVIHDFDARSSDELTLRRGDRIALVELDDGFGDGWYLGKHLGRGGTGLFPGGEPALIILCLAHADLASLHHKSANGRTEFSIEHVQHPHFHAVRALYVSIVYQPE